MSESVITVMKFGFSSTGTVTTFCNDLLKEIHECKYSKLQD